MKTFIYFSQGEWRTFQAEELPTLSKWVDCDVLNPMCRYHPKECDCRDVKKRYESEIAALEAKSLKVGNPEIVPKGVDTDLDETKDVLWYGKTLEWPGTVEVKEELEYPIDHTSYPPYIEVAILKLPQ